jgi:hypothetical protein
MPLQPRRPLPADNDAVLVCDDEEEWTDVSTARMVVRCLPCGGQGTLVARFADEAPHRGICAVCRGRGFSFGALRPAGEQRP